MKEEGAVAIVGAFCDIETGIGWLHGRSRSRQCEIWREQQSQSRTGARSRRRSHPGGSVDASLTCAAGHRDSTMDTTHFLELTGSRWNSGGKAQGIIQHCLGSPSFAGLSERHARSQRAVGPAGWTLSCGSQPTVSELAPGLARPAWSFQDRDPRSSCLCETR